MFPGSEDISRIYHGCNTIVDLPAIADTRHNLDLGTGFYTTRSLEHVVEDIGMYSEERHGGHGDSDIRFT